VENSSTDKTFAQSERGQPPPSLIFFISSFVLFSAEKVLPDKTFSPELYKEVKPPLIFLIFLSHLDENFSFILVLGLLQVCTFYCTPSINLKINMYIHKYVAAPRSMDQV
jgi:hypothetical protein